MMVIHCDHVCPRLLFIRSVSKVVASVIHRIFYDFMILWYRCLVDSEISLISTLFIGCSWWTMIETSWRSLRSLNFNSFMLIIKNLIAFSMKKLIKFHDVYYHECWFDVIRRVIISWFCMDTVPVLSATLWSQGRRYQTPTINIYLNVYICRRRTCTKMHMHLCGRAHVVGANSVRATQCQTKRTTKWDTEKSGEKQRETEGDTEKWRDRKTERQRERGREAQN